MVKAKARTANASLLSELSDAALNRLVANGYDPKALRTNRTLPKDKWKQLDDTIYEVARKKLQAINALRAEGVANPLDGLHVLFDQWETMSDMGNVTQSMDFRNRAENEAPEYNSHMIPIPITHGDFDIGRRKMLAMEAAGNITINQALVSQLTRHITEKLEDTIFQGTDVTLNGEPAPGLLTHPDAVNVTADPGWTGSWGSNPGSIYDDFKHLIRTAKDTNYSGPYLAFVATNEWDQMGIPDPEGTGDLELRDRIEDLAKISQLVEVDRMPSDHVVLVDPVPDVIQLSTASDITAIEWETQGGNVTNYKIFSAMAPRVQSDENGNTGIVYATDA